MTENQTENGDTRAVGAYELIASCVFDVSRDLVYKVWTDPAQLAVWWGPNGFENTEFDYLKWRG